MSVDLLVRGTGEPGRQRRKWVGPVLAGVVLVLVGLLTAQPSDDGGAFEPDSTGPSGLRGVLDVLRDLDVRVTVADDPASIRDADTVLVPPLGWEPDVVRDLAESGARVLAEVPPDEEAVLSPLGLSTVGLVDLEPECDLLADVTTLRTGQWNGWQPDTGTQVVQRCLTEGSTAWLHLVPVGDGELVSLSTMAPLVNQRLFDSDAALAGVRLLAPTGDERVAVLGPPPGQQPPTLFDLIDRRWFDAAWLTLVVLLVLALARGRRLGRPVEEQLPVRVPSGELARAIGDLRHRAGHDQRAAAQLRERTLTMCRRRLGMPADAAAETVLSELQAAGLATSPQVAAALSGPLPEDADGLVATARSLAELRATMRDRLTTSSPDTPSHSSEAP